MHTDHLNTPRKIAQPSTGTLAWRYDADPFGTVAPNQNPAGLGTFVYNLRFSGQYYQAETGLNQNVNRDYDPLIGKYDQSDPIGLRGGINTYAYVGDNPVGRRDPLGLLDNPAEIAPLLPPMPPPTGFLFGSYTEASVGPIRGAVEGIALVGHDNNGSYAGVIGAAGGELGGEQNYYGDFVGTEITTSCRKFRKITLKEISLGPEIPFLAGLGLGGGRYSTAEESGWFFFFSGGAAVMGHAALGFGFPTSSTHSSSCGCQ